MKFQNGKCTYAVFADAIIISKDQFYMTLPYTYNSEYDKETDCVDSTLTIGDFVTLGGCYEAEFPSDLLKIMDINLDEIIETSIDYLDLQVRKAHRDELDEQSARRLNDHRTIM